MVVESEFSVYYLRTLFLWINGTVIICVKLIFIIRTVQYGSDNLQYLLLLQLHSRFQLVVLDGRMGIHQLLFIGSSPCDVCLLM